MSPQMWILEAKLRSSARTLNPCVISPGIQWHTFKHSHIEWVVEKHCFYVILACTWNNKNFVYHLTKSIKTQLSFLLPDYLKDLLQVKTRNYAKKREPWWTFFQLYKVINSSCICPDLPVTQTRNRLRNSCRHVVGSFCTWELCTVFQILFSNHRENVQTCPLPSQSEEWVSEEQTLSAAGARHRWPSQMNKKKLCGWVGGWGWI